MLELQRIALRKHLQVIVTSHSPVVLDSVPPEARIFLDRDEETSEVRRAPLYRDVLQKALYGQSRDRLSILCEDEVAEGLLHGFMDTLNPKIRLRHNDYIIGRDTGQAEFPGHIRTLGKFRRLDDFLLVLDGDSRHLENRLKSEAEHYGQSVQPLFLPGAGPPEAWIWQTLDNYQSEYAPSLGIALDDMEQRMGAIHQVAQGGVRSQSPDQVALAAFADDNNLTVPEIARIVGRIEAGRSPGPASAFLTQLDEQVMAWRRR